MRKSYFIVSKPLQYVNATNIFDKYDKVCLFINGMKDGQKVFNRLKLESTYWSEMFFFEDRLQALTWLVEQDDVQNLYMDTDYGVRIQNKLRQIKANIFIYEEGVGTYRKSLRPNTFSHQVISKVNSIIGNPDYLGGFKGTSGVYVYDHKKHKEGIPEFRKLRFSFNKLFTDHLLSFKDLDVFFPATVKTQLLALKGEKVAIYLTSWSVKERCLNYLENYQDYTKILKPHPNIKDVINYPGIDIIIDGYIPVEMLLIFLIEICKEVVIIHERSSVILYLDKHENLKIIDLYEKN